MKRALCLAVVDTIRSELGYTSQQCEFMPDGQPPPSQGSYFVAVYEGGQQNAERNSLDRTFGVNVCVTVRLVAPRSKAGLFAVYRETMNGVEDRCEEIVNLLHMNEQVRQKANEYLLNLPPLKLGNGPTIYGFCESLSFERDLGTPQECQASWFGARPISEGANIDAPAGYRQELTFGGARRIQAIDTLRPATE